MTSKAKPRSRRRRLLLGVGIPLVLLFGITAWLLLFFPNGLVTRAAVSQAADRGFLLQIDRLDVRPLRGSVVVEGISLDVPENAAAGMTPFLQVDRYALDANAGELLGKRLHVRELHIVAPRITLERRDGTWNLDRINQTVETLTVSLGMTPDPSPTPPPADIQERLRAETDALRDALAGLPADVQVDRIVLRDAGLAILDEGDTRLRVTGVSGESLFQLQRDGTGRVEVVARPEDAIRFEAHAPDTTVRGVLQAEVDAELGLWDAGAFRGTLQTVATTVTLGPETYDAEMVATASGDFDAATGRLSVPAASVDAGDYFHAGGTVEMLGLGTKKLEAAYEAQLRGNRAPVWLSALARNFLQAESVNPGFEVEGTLTGTVTSTVPSELMAALESREIPATLDITARGKTEPHLISMAGIDLGGIDFDARVRVQPNATSIASTVHVDRVRVEDLLGPQALALDIDNAITIERMEDLAVERFSLAIPSRSLQLAGGGRIDGFATAVQTFLAGEGRGLNETQAGIAAVEATRAVDLAGTLAFNSKAEVELVPNVFASGVLNGNGRLRRGTAADTRLAGSVAYDNFSARVGTEVEVQGMYGQLDFLKTVVVGGAAAAPTTTAATPTDVVFVEKAIEEFDPAERGYYSRLAPYRRNRENLKVERIRAGAYVIEDMIADVTYDGEAVRAAYVRMNVLGGETVARAYVRPEPGGIRIAYFADFAGIDIAPVLRENPPESSDDATRVNGSSAASTFIPSADPIKGIAEATARLDFTAAGSRVVEEVLVFLDPEQADPVFNWARNVNQNVQGLSRPELNLVLNRGFYDVTIGFPSLGVAKDVRRIPLGQTLALNFSRGLLEDLLPPEEILQLASARGIDRNGDWILPPPASP